MRRSGSGERREYDRGPQWEQKDAVTVISLPANDGASGGGSSGEDGRQLLARFELPSQPGNERRATEQVSDVVAPVGLPPGKLDRLKTAVAEATMNAMEHGNRYAEDKPVLIEVARENHNLTVSITDRGGSRVAPEAETPDLTAKLAGQQSPRGWGLFLIQNMVDEVRVITDEVHHTVKLVIYLAEGAQSGTAK
jgi:anti-sigma regulatory factor (Ser/Thr protein kinase)